MYTSGTTGLPKGAVLSHRKTFFNCLNADIFFKLHFEDIMLIVLPLFHSGGLFIQASPILYKGATMIIHPKFDPAKTFQDMERSRVTKFLGVPTVYRALLRVGPEKRGNLSYLEVCAIGGEKTTPELLARCKEAGFPLRQIMGQTETSILLWASEDDSLRKPGTVGRPVFHADVSLIDRDGRQVKPGEVGEIVVRGSVMMKEYWQDPVRTEETIKNGWLHTGDLARMDDEGYFYIVDRARDMYISGGENVYPAEAERVLKEHPDIADVAVVGVPDETWGETGHAFVILKPGSCLCVEDVAKFCNGKLARYKWPKKVTFCRDFPRTSLGKVRKPLLIREDGGKTTGFSSGK
jgi:fatty-acyl-CoA synthase